MPKIKFSKEERELIIPFIQQYFAEERDEEMGELAAGFVLDFVLETIGPFIYNKGIQDAQTYLRLRMTEIEEGLYELEQMPPR
jgi:uncharacterized protein (DUF2164 family)